jgi:hypothetical protein
MQNLLPPPPPTLLPADHPAQSALEAARARTADQAGTGTADQADLATVAAAHPAFSGAWAALAERALSAGDPVAGYAYARTGYHRGLDQLRRSGWHGSGPVPWSHQPNRGFLRCLHLLSRAAGAIGETDEAARCGQFLRDCDPAAADALGRT